MDTSAADAPLHFTSRLTDDMAGVEYGQAFFNSPSGTQSIVVTFRPPPLTGTVLDGTYESTTVLPRFSEQGTWRLSLFFLNDAVGNSRALREADLAAAGFPTTFENRTVPALTSIVVTPTNAVLPKGLSQQFVATGTYGDGSRADLTASVSWMSSSPGVATLTTGGLAFGQEQGETTISATLGSTSGSTSLTVAPPSLVSVAVTPETMTIRSGQTLAYTATATYTDSTTANVTQTATWSTSRPSVASVDTAGVARGRAPGETTVLARYLEATSAVSRY